MTSQPDDRLERLRLAIAEERRLQKTKRNGGHPGPVGASPGVGSAPGAPASAGRDTGDMPSSGLDKGPQNSR
jgi:hypothetical protein